MQLTITLNPGHTSLETFHSILCIFYLKVMTSITAKVAQRNFKRGGSPCTGEVKTSSSPCSRERTVMTASHIRDWHSKIELTMAKGYLSEHVKLAMFKSMEDMLKEHAFAINADTDRMVTPSDLLEGLDELYGMKMTFQSLSTVLCVLQQWPYESCWDYYDCMVKIMVLLSERHSNQFRPGELTRMTKDYFYVGLWAKHQPIVAHLKDRLTTSCLNLLTVFQENEQNDAQAHTRYPTNMTPPQSNGQARPQQHVRVCPVVREILMPWATVIPGTQCGDRSHGHLSGSLHIDGQCQGEQQQNWLPGHPGDLSPPAYGHPLCLYL